MADKDWLKIENRIRATPLDLLKQGIERGQWEAVCASYTMLTGVVLPPPQLILVEGPMDAPLTDGIPFSAEEQKDEPTEEEKEIVEDDDDDIEDDEEQDDDEYDDTEENEEDDTDFEHKRKRNKRIRTRTAPVRGSGKNLFVPDDADAAEDLAFMPKPEVLAKRRKKRRPEYKTVKKRCSKCGTVDRVDPVVAAGTMGKDPKTKMRYVCNDCSCGGGS